MQKKFLYPALAAVLLIAAGYFFWSLALDSKSDTAGEVSDPTNEAIPSDATTDVASQGDGYTVELLPDEGEDFPAPNAHSIASKPSSMEDDVYAQIARNIESTAVTLDAGDNFNAWMNIASYRAILEDYQGAEEVLLFLSRRFAPAWEVHANLGNLYTSYIVDLSEAAGQYKKAIVLLPQNGGLYRSLSDVYAKQGERERAVAALKDGITNVPQAVDLYVLLARFLRDGGDATSARSYYDQAIEQARIAGNIALQAEIEAERDAI